MSESGGSGSSLAQSWFPPVSPVTNVAEREQGGGGWGGVERRVVLVSSVASTSQSLVRISDDESLTGSIRTQRHMRGCDWSLICHQPKVCVCVCLCECVLWQITEPN